MSGPDKPGLRLWDDNPSLIDLLGFDAVVNPILEAIETPHLDPVTIGVQSPWGGGKSTVINLLGSALEHDPDYVVVRTDPWQYDNHDDVRGILIAEILDALRTEFDKNGAITKRIGELLQRISWARVAVAVGKGAAGLGWTRTELVEAFTPRKRTEPETMSGFKDAFAGLMEMLPETTKRVVVLIDDLDRCLPPAVMGTLEAIKLFLAVPKMVFVLAADQDLIRDAVAAHLAGTNRSETFAMRYLEKIVQLPISLPRLSEEDAETYIALLLAARDAPDVASFEAVAGHAAKRRNENLWPLLSEWPDGVWQPPADALRLARQLREGLAADRLSSPRQVKRFLNAYGVRSSIAGSRGVDVAAPVAVKLRLLEDRHRPAFDRLASWPASERRANIELWERWAAGDADDAPEGIDASTKEWARAEPSLADVDLTGYLRLAASLLNTAVGAAVSDAVVELVRDLLDDSEPIRMAALVAARELASAEQAAAVALLIENGLRADDANAMWLSAIRWAPGDEAVAEIVVDAVRQNMSRLTIAVPFELKAAGLPALAALLTEIAVSAAAPVEVAEAARMELEP
jgi:hypothetical protein